MKLDLNCDLGEGEPLSRTRALMRCITSANVACGGHAGDPATMENCVRLAKREGVRLGAHPGPWSRGDFGRGAVSLTPDALELLLLQQVGALERIASKHRVRVRHIKLHGALYHASEDDLDLGRRYVAAVKRWWPRCVVFARAGGSVAAIGRRSGIEIWEEAFADRGYRDDGTLVPRGEPGALLTDSREIVARVRLLAEHGEIEGVSGSRFPVNARTICVHSDTASAPALARAARRAVEAR